MTIWLNWLVPSVIGFAIGVIVGYLVRGLVQDRPASTGPRRWIPSPQAALGLLLIVLAGLTYFQAYRSTACIRDGVLERSEAQGRETRAQIELLETENPDRDPEIARAAVERYLEAARELEAARVANPLRCP